MDLSLGLQQRPQQSPTGIGNSTGQLVILPHPRYVQIIQHNRLVLTDEPGAELVEMIQPLVRHLDMSLGQA